MPNATTARPWNYTPRTRTGVTRPARRIANTVSNAQMPGKPFGSTGVGRQGVTGHEGGPPKRLHLKFICWRSVYQRLSSPLTEFPGDVTKLRLRVNGQIPVRWKVVSRKSIRILVRSPLPRTLWIAKAELQICSNRNLLMLRRQRLARRRDEAILAVDYIAQDCRTALAMTGLSNQPEPSAGR
jgi:hypothetical protein